MDQVMKSISALNDLRNSLSNIEPFGDEFKARCKVTYTALGEVNTEILYVFILVGGYEPTLKLDIYGKGEIITSNKYHKDFNPAFTDNTKFLFDKKSKTLTVKGINSPKLGDYTVLIEEAF